MISIVKLNWEPVYYQIINH